MADVARRTTMQLAIDPAENARSGIPVPASTSKKPAPASRIRQSFAGLQQSSSQGRSYNGNPLLQSASKPGPAAFGRTPLRNSVRRASQWPGARPSMLPPPFSLNQPMKDTRAIREKPVQQSMRNAIFTWLQESGYTHTLSRQSLLSPTAKDFRNIFEHLIGFLDPAFMFSIATKAFEDEVIPVLKSQHYPFVDAIDKKWLAAPASMHSWPALLAAIHWLVELSKARMRYFESHDSTLQSIDQVPEVFDEPNHHFALVMEYYSEAYGVFLDGKDDFSNQDMILEDRYAKKSESILAELESLNGEFVRLKAEEQELSATPFPKVKLEELNKFIKRDKKKIDEVIVHCENRKRKTLLNIGQERQAIADYTAILEKLRQEQEQLSIKVKQQNLSPDQVTRMNTEHETLTRNLEDLRKKSAETSRAALALEVPLAQRIEAVDHAIDDYTTLLFELDLNPTVPPPLPPTDLRLESNFASENPKELVRRVADHCGVDMKSDIKPTLDAIADSKRRQRRTLEDEEVNIEQEIDQVSAECQKVKEEIRDLENRTAVLQEQAEETREAAQQENLISNGEATRLEKELGQARTKAMAHGRGVKARLQALHIADQEQIERTERLRDETVRAIVKNSSDIALFKEEVSNYLNHLRQFAEEN